jgi:four helix bundle protein
MGGARSFTELRFWQRARKWSADIFEQTTRPPFARDERLVVQINDSSESVMSNMAEGFGRGTQEEFIKFLGYALGSLDETQSHLCAAYDRKYISKEQFAQFFGEGTEIRQLTVAFIRSMIMTPRRRSHARQATDLVEPSVGNLRARHRQTAASDVGVDAKRVATSPAQR